MIFERGKRIPNTFGIEAKANRWVEYDSLQGLRQAVAEGLVVPPYLNIGSGSNLLFLKDFEGTILHCGIKGIEVLESDACQVLLRVGAGVVWDDLVAYCVEHGYYGLENLSGIPGEVGASAVQNIGAYGVEVKDAIVEVETVNAAGEMRTYRAEECGYSYRSSLFKRPEMKSVFIGYVTFRLGRQEKFSLEYSALRQELQKPEYPKITLQSVRQAVIAVRDSKLPDPAVLGNAGSFFMNPVVPRRQYDELLRDYPDMPCYPVDEESVKVPAGWLIDRSGWKGRALGRAGVYEKQALVLVNLGGASGADIVALSDAVRASVSGRFGIELRPEVNFI